MRALALLVVLLTSLVAAPSAEAQEAWLILPVATDDSTSWMESTASQLREEMAERRLQVWSLEGATRKFERRASSPATRLSSTEIEQWVERSQEALRYLAAGDYARARRELTALQELSTRVLEEIDQKEGLEEDVLDSCLDMVRLMLETRTQGEAKEQARACRRLVPRAEPGRNRHPPAVLTVLGEVDQETNGTGVLAITSEPAGCAFRINGLSYGATPDSMRLFFGDYRVQADCTEGERGRVHQVKIDSEDAKVFIDARFDSVVRTQPFLRLAYPDDSTKNRWLAEDASAVQAAVKVSHVLLISSPQEGMLRVELLGKSKNDPKGTALINTSASGPSREDVDLAVKTILNHKCMDYTATRPTSLAGCDGGGGKSWPPDRTPKKHFWSGVALASLGSASLIAGYGLHIGRKNAGDTWESDPANTALQVKWINSGTGVIVAGSVGGASLVASMPLVLPYRSKTPWWAWLSGGLGLVAVAGSIASGVSIPATIPDCGVQTTMPTTVDACVSHGQKRDLAILLAMTAAPLLTMPLVYLFRPDKGPATVKPNIEIGRNGGRFSVSGEF